MEDQCEPSLITSKSGHEELIRPLLRLDTASSPLSLISSSMNAGTTSWFSTPVVWGSHRVGRRSPG